MPSQNFDQPTLGQVTSDGKVALEVRNSGKGGSVKCISPDTGFGLWAEGGTGIQGQSNNGVGVFGVSQTYRGVFGTTNSGFGVVGSCDEEGTGVWGVAPKGTGVFGESAAKFGMGVKAVSTSSEEGYGLRANSRGPRGGAVWGTSLNSNPDSRAVGVNGTSFGGNGIGVRGQCSQGIGVRGSGKIAGRFDGDVEVTGDIKLLNPQNADCAEDFDILDRNIEPGTVMVLTENGSLQSSHQEYDKKVAGVVSGAGGYRPAMVLARQQESQVDQKNKKKNRLPIALMGKVYCKVDARHSSIETGDLLTTSSTKGYAMKAEDPIKSFGAVIGKALGSIKEGLGMIPVLVTL